MILSCIPLVNTASHSGLIISFWKGNDGRRNLKLIAELSINEWEAPPAANNASFKDVGIHDSQHKGVKQTNIENEYS